MKIVTISREFGSGGREIGKRLADELGFKYYDKEIIKAIADDTKLHEEYVAKTLESNYFGFHFSFGRTLSGFSSIDQNAIDVLISQEKIIKELASQGDCVLVGRNSNIILAKQRPFDIFVYADMDAKIKRCKERAPECEHLTDRQYKKFIKQIDAGRARFHALLSSTKWGDKKEYDLMVNTTEANIKEIVPIIAQYAKVFFKNNNL